MKTRKPKRVYTQEEFDFRTKVIYNDGFTKGKAEGIKEAQAKYNYQNTMLEAVKQQTAAMECTTRLITAIVDGGMR